MSCRLLLEGRTQIDFAVSSACLDQIARVAKTDARSAVEVVFGDDSVELGEMRQVPRESLSNALREVLAAARTLPGNFFFHIEKCGKQGEPVESDTGGVSGFMINGEYCSLKLYGDHWVFGPIVRSFRTPPPARQYEPAEIKTDNWGVIKVQSRKLGKNSLRKLAKEMEKFVSNDSSEQFGIALG